MSANWREATAPGGHPLRIRVLTGPFERMRGLLGRDGLPEGDVYLFPRCASVHTFGMRFAIDIAFLDRDGRVTQLLENVPPWRIVLGGRGATATVEAGTGWLGRVFTVGEAFPIPAPRR